MDIKELAFYLYMESCERKNREQEEAEGGSDEGQEPEEEE